MWRWYISSDSCYCLDKTTITFQVIPTFNIPPLSPLTLPLPLHLPYLTLFSLHTSWHSWWLTWSAHGSVTGLLALWRKKLQTYTLCLKVKVDPCLDLSSPSLHSSTCLSLRSAYLSPFLPPLSIHPPVLALRPIQKMANRLKYYVLDYHKSY